MRKTLTTITAVLINLVIGYIALSFTAWSFDIREWHWILRALLLCAFVLTLIYVPFNKKSFIKV